MDLFDLRVLNPLNINKIFNYVKKTGRLLIADLGYKKLGIGAEIASQVYEKHFHQLKIPIIRIGMPDHPVPSSRGYLKNIYPNSINIVSEICHSLNVSDQNIKKITNALIKEKLNEPIDTPFSKFKGPF